MKKIKYQCFKAYEESTRYFKDGNSIIFRSVYHYAELVYNSGSQLPVKSIDGNYYDVPDPQKAEIGSVYLDRIDFNFTNKVAEDIYRKQSAEMTVVEFEKLIISLGFQKKIYQMMFGKGTALLDE